MVGRVLFADAAAGATCAAAGVAARPTTDEQTNVNAARRTSARTLYLREKLGSHQCSTTIAPRLVGVQVQFCENAPRPRLLASKRRRQRWPLAVASRERRRGNRPRNGQRRVVP